MEANRYHRHSLIDWFSQDEVAKSHIAVVGAGAVGNEVLKNLALLGVGSIDIFDFDNIEVHNLTRSVLFRESDIGESKAKVAADRILDLEPNISVRVFEGDFWGALKLQMLETYTSVICCVDNLEARIKLNLLCRLLGKDLVNTAIDSRYACIESFPFSCSNEAACYECTLPATAYQRMSERYSCGWLRRVAHYERKIPTTIVTSSIAGAYAASMALRLGSQTKTSVRLLFDTIGGHGNVTTLLKNPDCPTCSTLTHPVVRVRVQNRLLTDFPGLAHIRAEDIIVRSSEQILTRYRCVNCDSQSPDPWHIVFDRASRYDDSFAICPRCGQASVVIEIRDEFNLFELLSMYPGRSVPAKFLTLPLSHTMYVLDLEDESNE